MIKNILEISTLSQFGSVFFLFSHGLEYRLLVDNRSKIKLQRDAAICYLFATIGISVSIQIYCGILNIVSSQVEGFLVGFSVSLSSLTVALGFLHENNLISTAEGKIILNYLTLQGLAVAFMFSIPSFISRNDQIRTDFQVIFIEAIVIAVIWWTINNLSQGSYSLVSRVTQKIAKKPISHDKKTSADSTVAPHTLEVAGELKLLAVVSFALTFSLMTESMDLSLDFGAFLAGLILGGTTSSEQSKKSVQPLASVFASLLFASIGMMINPLFVFNNFSILIVLIFTF